MKNILMVTGVIAVLVIAVAAGIIVYMQLSFPDVDKPPEISVKGTPEQVERGKYPANHVRVCMECHSDKDWEKYLLDDKGSVVIHKMAAIC